MTTSSKKESSSVSKPDVFLRDYVHYHGYYTVVINSAIVGHIQKRGGTPWEFWSHYAHNEMLPEVLQAAQDAAVMLNIQDRLKS